MKNLYEELSVDLYLISTEQICSTKILTTLLRSEAELKTKPNSDSTLAIKVIISPLFLCALSFFFFFNTNTDLKEHL